MLRIRSPLRYDYWPYVCMGLIAIGCIKGAIALPTVFMSHTTLTQAKPVVGQVAAEDIPMQHVDEPSFGIDIPTNWRAVAPPTTQPSAYSWSGLASDGTGRRLDVYIDHVPQSLAANRLLPVDVVGDRISPVAPVSDNCSTFTDKATMSAATSTALAKWAGINFICDMGNYERDVVTIGSTSGINDVTVTGRSTGVHHVMFVYTANSIDPSFVTLSTVVQSFQAR